ncbi:MAG: GGDEF domain-containing protein [Actinomycetota bacterium]|nr:GGDEF domain-containing protein [Actinomycetota bacterium]
MTRDDAAVEMTEAWEQPVGAGLLHAAVALTLGYLVQAVVDPFTVSGVRGVVLGLVSFAAAMVLAGLGMWLWRSGFPGLPSRHRLASGVALLVTVIAVAHLVIAEQPWQLGSVMLAAVGAGAALLSRRWYAGTLCGVWVLWAAGVLAGLMTGAPTGLGWHSVLGLVAATVFAVLLAESRRRWADRLDEARRAARSSAVDDLTGLANRRGLSMVGSRILESARRRGDAVHCVMVDVHEGIEERRRADDLTAARDVRREVPPAGRLRLHVPGRPGHSAEHRGGQGPGHPGIGQPTADEVLIVVADALRSLIRATDVVARWGDGEFCIVGPGVGADPLIAESRLRERLRNDPTVGVRQRPLRVSAGGAVLAPWDAGTLDTLLETAEEEMYARRVRRHDPRSGAKPTTAPGSVSELPRHD